MLMKSRIIFTMTKTNKNECFLFASTGETLAYEPWVEWDEALCVDNVVELGVQVNGKKRGAVELSKEADADEAQAAALAIPGVSKFVDDKPIKKLIYVPGRIINIIV